MALKLNLPNSWISPGVFLSIAIMVISKGLLEKQRAKKTDASELASV
jgi:hypothetical protein